MQVSKGDVAELRCVVWERLSTLRHAEWHRKRGKERACKRSAFISNPCGNLLGEKCHSQVTSPKEEINHIEQFRIISLLSFKCKTFFKIVANHLMGFLLKNTYIDTSVQKRHSDSISVRNASKKPGKLFTGNLKDTTACQGTSDDLDTWLSAMDRSGLPGKFKAWIYQHGILPHFLWLLLVYEVRLTIEEGFERKINQFLRRWLGLPWSLSSIALFGHDTMLKLLFSSLAEEFKVT
ncbi:hypothetical protein NFI96_007741 [Prochilodus magdalenae]|nr:hypothetical protein NFI96_007741 [Prochilodus magdalenae]